MKNEKFHSNYTYLFGFGLLVLGAAWIMACIGYMVHYFPEHGGGAVVMFSLAALFGAFFIHFGRALINREHSGSQRAIL